ATVPVSYWPGGSVGVLTDQYIKTVIVFVLLTNVIDNRHRLINICWAMVCLSVPLALTTIQNFAAGAFFSQGSRVVGTQGALTGNPNDMALMLNLILPLCVALLLSASSKLMRIALASVIGLLVAAIVVTFSRAGFLTLCVTFLCYMWLLRNR